MCDTVKNNVAKADSQSRSTKDDKTIENEISRAITECKTLIKNNKSFLKPSTNSSPPMRENVSLGKLASEMTFILTNLKEHIKIPIPRMEDPECEPKLNCLPTIQLQEKEFFQEETKRAIQIREIKAKEEALKKEIENENARKPTNTKSSKIFYGTLIENSRLPRALAQAKTNSVSGVSSVRGRSSGRNLLEVNKIVLQSREGTTKSLIPKTSNTGKSDSNHPSNLFRAATNKMYVKTNHDTSESEINSMLSNTKVTRKKSTAGAKKVSGSKIDKAPSLANIKNAAAIVAAGSKKTSEKAAAGTKLQKTSNSVLGKYKGSNKKGREKDTAKANKSSTSSKVSLSDSRRSQRSVISDSNLNYMVKKTTSIEEEKPSADGPSKNVVSATGNRAACLSNSANISDKYSLSKVSSTTTTNSENHRLIEAAKCMPHPNLMDQLKEIREDVEKAIRDRRTFTVRGCFPPIRKALQQRGWVEKYQVSYRDRYTDEIRKFQSYSVQELANLMNLKNYADICRRVIRSKLLAAHQVDFYWGVNYDAFTINPDKNKLTIINKFRRDVFSYTSKQGLSQASKDSYWFNVPGVAGINHPRSYSLTKNGETKDFIRDFNITAASSLLKWVVKTASTKEQRVASSYGKIPLEAFEFALNECYKFVKKANNEDIDVEIKDALDHEWSQFLEYYYKTVHIGNHFKKAKGESEDTLIQKSLYMLELLKPYWPHLKMDGIMNIWILKPTGGSRGEGIHICRTLQYILQVVKNNSNIRYVIQKYIERPLLIYNTKFDIRQWFLISCAEPLTIWMYRECYLRFSSQTYNLRKLHESIHLTNNSVQSRYRSNSRDITLPPYNMWDSKQFKTHLSNIGFPDAFDKEIYKGMKECIIAAVLMHQDKIDKRPNCFELYGADFMITEDFKPWLLEINSSPALHASTPVTSKMCPQVLEDVIKVVVDYSTDKSASTGKFELIYEETIHPIPKGNTVTLKLSGRHLNEDYFYTPSQTFSQRESIEDTLMQQQQQPSLPVPPLQLNIISDQVKKTLESLLLYIQSEKHKRLSKKNERIGTSGSQEILIYDRCKRDCATSSTGLLVSKISPELESELEHARPLMLTQEECDLLEHGLILLKTRKKRPVLKYLLHVIGDLIRNKEG